VDPAELAKKLLPAAVAGDDDDVWAWCRARAGAVADADLFTDAVRDPALLHKLKVPAVVDVLRRWSESGHDDLLERVASDDDRRGVAEELHRLQARPRSRPSLGELWAAPTPEAVLDHLATLKPLPGHKAFPAAAAKALRMANCDASVLVDALLVVLSGSDERFATSGQFHVAEASMPAPAWAVVGAISAVNTLLSNVPSLVVAELVARRDELDTFARVMLVVAVAGAPQGRGRRRAGQYEFLFEDLDAACKVVDRSGQSTWELDRLSDVPASGAPVARNAAAVRSNLLVAALRSGLEVMGPRSVAALAGLEDPSSATAVELATLVDLLVAGDHTAAVTELVTVASCGGTRAVHLPGFEARALASSTPFAVAAAVAPTWMTPTEVRLFAATIGGQYGHRWSADEVVAGLAAHPDVATAFLSGLAATVSSPTTAPRWLVELSMRTTGLAPWVATQRWVAAELVAVLSGAGPTTVSAALGLLSSGFAGTPDELVDVAAAAAP
jgi:hypothetical protein